MSKTDKTRPFKAQVPDSPREYHDHTKGECDLPTLDEWRKMPRRAEWKRNCGWQPANWHTYKGFGRSKGERFWRTEDRKRKASKKRERVSDPYDMFDNEEEITGCQNCADHGGMNDY